MDRDSLLETVEQLIESSGKMVSRASLAAHLDISRARIDAAFPDEDSLFDALVERWYAPDVAIMEEVLASDLPPRRKLYEFIARRFVRERGVFQDDPAAFALMVELGTERFEQVRGYIELADHYMAQVIAEAQAEGHFPGLSIDAALSLINQMVVPYTSPQVLMMLHERLTEEKLGLIVDTLFDGLSGEPRGARSVQGLRPVE